MGGRVPRRGEVAPLLCCLRSVAEPVPCLPQSSGSRFGNCPFPHLQTGHKHDPPSPGNPGLHFLQGPTPLSISDTHTLQGLLKVMHSNCCSVITFHSHLMLWAHTHRKTFQTHLTWEAADLPSVLRSGNQRHVQKFPRISIKTKKQKQ